MSRLLLKVCCIQDEREMLVARDAGATHVGFVGPMPSGQGPIPDADIARIAASAPDDVTTVLLTSRTDPAAIVDHVRSTGVRAVQIVRHVPATTRHAVRAALPSLRILQVVHVEGPGAVAMAAAAADGADYVLLDSGRPSADTPELGGTGRTHDWTVSADIVRNTSVPVFLAGGLKPGNVRDAVEAVRPAGLDFCSGVRDARGRLVPERLADLVANARAG